MMNPKAKFKVGDKVILIGNPYDEQIEDELLKYCKYKNTVCTILKIEGESIKTTVHGWISPAWFKKVKGK
jgi:hypothetical protein